MAEQTTTEERQSVPSTVRTVADLHQVMVDQWGHRGEYTRGQIIDINDLDPTYYDHEHAVRVGVLRPLTEAEARSWPTTSPTNEDGSLDEDHQRAMQFHAGIQPGEGPRTVTTEQGPAEPAELSKPTIAYTGENAPSPRPIVTASAYEAETEGMRAARIVPTSSGSVFESPAEREARAPSSPRRRGNGGTSEPAPSESAPSESNTEG